jgi:hypothetical protein
MVEDMEGNVRLKHRLATCTCCGYVQVCRKRHDISLKFHAGSFLASMISLSSWTLILL